MTPNQIQMIARLQSAAQELITASNLLLAELAAALEREAEREKDEKEAE